MSSIIFRKPRWFQLALNSWAPYWGTGISIADISTDFRHLRVQMKQRFYNRNAFGTHFGGSLYAMCDPFYVLQLVALLGDDYLIWDKSASIDFIKPGRGTVSADFDWSDEQLNDIRAQTASGAKYEPVRVVEVKDAAGDVIARVHKTLYIRRKRSA